MKLNQLTATPGATKERKRIGRGYGAGTGKTAGKGHKGQKARAGHEMCIRDSFGCEERHCPWEDCHPGERAPRRQRLREGRIKK